MIGKLTTICFVQHMIVAAVSLMSAQDPSTKISAPRWNLQVEITMDKNVYVRDEPVRYRVTLLNSGKSAVYVAKSFSNAGGGIAGFYVDVKHLTGKRSPCGGFAVDRVPLPDARTPEQILGQDFLLLHPGELIGFESGFDCIGGNLPSGTYQMTATYAAQDLNIDKVRLLADKADSIIVGRIRSKPLTFRIRDRR